MTRINLAGFIEQGKQLAGIRFNVGMRLKDLVSPFERARVALRLIQSPDSPYPLTRPHVQGALDAMEKLLPEKLPDGFDLNHEITTWDLQFFIIGCLKFLTVFDTEIGAQIVYYFEQKGIYSTQSLVEGAEVMFSPDVLSLFPPEFIPEVRQAGKCIAFEIPTAAAFFLFRAVEVCILKCLRTFAPGVIFKDSQRNWGKYIEALEGASFDPRITDKLKELKDDHRNPIMHPEVTVTDEEFHAVLSPCMTSVHYMAAALAKKEGRHPKLALLLP